jgi:hypothetical protein
VETNSQLLVQTLTPVVEVLERLNIPYHIGGSVASSLYGTFRPTQDVDLVADLHLAQVRPFVKSLELATEGGIVIYPPVYPNTSVPP